MELVREVSVLIRTGQISTAEGHVVNVSNYDVSLLSLILIQIQTVAPLDLCR